MNRLAFLIAHVLSIVLAAALLLTGCGGPKPAADETTRVTVPVNTRVSVDDEAMRVIWNLQGDESITGYNIYISEEPLVDQYPGQYLPEEHEPWNGMPYPGDTDPDDGMIWYDATGLENGVVYHVSVRVVYPDRTLSRPSNEVQAVCGPRGEIELGIRYRTQPDGFSFVENDFVDADHVANDLYFFSQNGTDYLASPSRLDGFLRANRLMVLPLSGDFETVSAEVTGSDMSPDEDQVAVNVDDWVLMQMPDESYALLQVTGLSGTGDERRISVSYAYSPRAGEIFF
ncbi:hypothetical protein GF377_01085 [candidate division GN15 bacterium]|nr:hypothetical protein [candidate division GN15 bacterium]